MKSTKTILAVAIVIAGIAGIAGIAFSQETAKEPLCVANSPCSLQGKPTVSVLVEEFSEDLKRAGISKAELKTEAELLLRKFGVPVVSNGSHHHDLRLYIDVTGKEVTRNSDGRGIGDYWFVLTCEAQQPVRLHRNPSIAILDAATWITDAQRSGYMTSRKSLRNAITNGVQQDTKEFINAYLEANPK